MIAYKRLFRTSEGKLVSLFTEGQYMLEYRFGEWTAALPRTLGIFCFDTEEAAKYLMDEVLSQLPVHIYEVEGENEREMPALICGNQDENHLDNFYAGKMRRSGNIYPQDGIVLFECVKLIREIA